MGVGSKSDVRRVMSQALLAPIVRNPWRNPMKSGIVSPAYDPTETIAYRYGPLLNVGALASNHYYSWPADTQGIGNEDGAYWGVFHEWNVEPGEKTITSLVVEWAFWSATYVDELYVDVWRDDTTEYTLVATSGALTPVAAVAGTAVDTITLTTPLSVTLAAGETYFIGIRCKRTDANADVAYVHRTNGVVFSTSTMRMAVSASQWNGSTVSQTDVPNELYTYTDANNVPQITVYYTSENYVERDITSDTVGNHIIPIATASAVDPVIKLETVVVEDTNALTMLWAYSAKNQVATTSDTTELDMGDTTGEQNDLITAGVTVNLPDIGGNGQEGKTFDITAIIDNSAAKYDLYWQNRHLEGTVHAHAIANDGNHGATKHTCGSTAYIAISGTATIGKVRVGVKPVVLVGDSQVNLNSGTNLRSPYRLGKIADYLTKDRITIMHGESGITFASIYGAVYNGTAGAADGIDLRGLGCTWFFGGPGINDISAATTESDTDAAETVLELMDVYSTFLESLVSVGETVILTGLPPYSHTNADEYEAKAVRWLNRALMGLALAIRVPHYNPWPDMVDPATVGDTIPTFSTDYDESANHGLHYDDATGAPYALQNGVVPAFENATIDLRDAWS